MGMYKCLCGETFGSTRSWEDHKEWCPSHPFVPEVQKPAAKAPSALDTQVGGGHYKDRAIQPIEFIHANGLNFIEGSVVKYITRWRDKNGVQDLEKIKHYVDLLIELESATPRSPARR